MTRAIGLGTCPLKLSPNMIAYEDGDKDHMSVQFVTIERASVFFALAETMIVFKVSCTDGSRSLGKQGTLDVSVRMRQSRSADQPQWVQSLTFR